MRAWCQDACRAVNQGDKFWYRAGAGVASDAVMAWDADGASRLVEKKLTCPSLFDVNCSSVPSMD